MSLEVKDAKFFGNTKIFFIFAETNLKTMPHNTDNPAFPIIEYLNEMIKEAEESREHWEQNYQHPMADYYRKVAVNRIAAFKEVLEFINDNFNDNGE